MTRWSTESCTVITVATASAPAFTTGRCSPAPTARMPACGGLMIAAKCVTPYIPMFEIEKPPPWNSSGFSLPALARAPRSFISAEMAARPLRSAWRTMGVISPSGMATATEMSTSSYWRIASSLQEALTPGWRRSATAQALMTRSLTESLKAPGPSFGDWALRSPRSLSSASSSMSIAT